MFKQTRMHQVKHRAADNRPNKSPAEKPARFSISLSLEERSRLVPVRAYELWEQAGNPDGNAERFWYEAEKEMFASHSPGK